MAAAPEDSVALGDSVTFESDSGSCLSVDLCDNVVWSAPRPGSKVPSLLSRCIWRVVDKLSYSDQCNYAARRSHSSPEEVEVLKQQSDKEKARNAFDLAHLSGKQALYGAVVQFQHVATGKFLAARNTPAKISRDCLGLYLDNGAASVYFQMLPRYKVRSVGSSVLSDDVVLMVSQSSTGYHLHESIGDAKEGEIPIRECNLSRVGAACGIKVNIFERPSPAYDEEHLHVHQCLRFFDKENDSFIVPNNNVPVLQHVGSVGSYHDHPDNFTADAVWVLEYAAAAKRRIGGLIEWNIPQYRIKHVPSKKYLTVGTSKVLKVNAAAPIESKKEKSKKSVKVEEKTEADDEEEYHLELSLESTIQGDADQMHRQTFCFNYVDAKKEYVPVQKTYVNLIHLGAGGTPWYAHAVGGEDNPLILSSVKHSFDALLLVKVSNVEAAAVRFTGGVVPVLKSYIKRLEGLSGAAKKRDVVEIMQQDYVSDTLTHVLVQSAMGMGSVVAEGGRGLKDAKSIKRFEEHARPNKMMQDCMRSQGVLELLLQIVVAPVNAQLSLKFSTAKAPQVRRGSVAGKKDAAAAAAVYNDWEDARFRDIALTHQLAWSALRQLTNLNAVSTVYLSGLTTQYRSMSQTSGLGGSIADTGVMAIILEQVPYPVGAAVLLTSMVDDTKELLMKVVDKKTISYFKTLISDFGPQARFLEFYEAICSCQNEPVDRNQNIVLEELITGLKNPGGNVLITLYTLPGQEYDAPIPSDTNSDGQALDTRFLGQDYVENGGKKKGYPRIYVAWEWSDSWKVGSDSLYWSANALGIQMETVVPNTNLAAQDTSDMTPHQKRVHALQQRSSHVAIEELCWVLNKEMFYHKVRKGGDTDTRSKRFSADVSETETQPWNAETEKRFNARKTANNDGHGMVAQYLYAQVELLSEMVYGRNYTVIHALEEMFPYVLLVSVVSSTTLPFQVRGSFVKLLNRLWVDRYPSELNVGRQSLPDVVWSVTELRDVALSEPDAFPHFELHSSNPLYQSDETIYNISGPFKYKLLISFVDSFVAEVDRLVTENVHQNHCVKQVMALLANLASFGFFPSTEMLAKLVSTLLPMIDGRSDVQLNSDKVTDKIIHTTDASCVALVERYKLNSKSGVIMEAKVSMLKAIGVVIDLRQHFRLHRLLYTFTQWQAEKAANPQSFFNPLDIHFDPTKLNPGGVVGGAAGLAGNVVGGAAGLGVNVVGGTAALGLNVVGGTVSALTGGLLGGTVSADQLTGGFLKQQEDAGAIAGIFDIFDEANAKMNNLHLDNLCPISYGSTLIDLLMYDSVPLFEIALNCLEFFCVPMKSLIAVSDEVLLLPDENLPVFGTLAMFDLYVSQLKQAFETQMMWGDIARYANVPASQENSKMGQLAAKSFGIIWNIMEAFYEFLDPSMIAAGNPLPLECRQQLFVSFDVHRILMRVISWDFDLSMLKTKGVANNFIRASKTPERNSLFRVAQGSFSLLRMIVYDNDEARDQFKQYVSLLSEGSCRTIFPVRSYAVLSEIYRGSVSQVESTPKLLFQLFGDLFHADSDPSVSLEFFLNQMVPSATSFETIPRNQKLVADYLTMKGRPSHHIAKFEAASLNNDQFEYHVSAIEVLGHCCHSNIDVAATAGPWVPWVTATARCRDVLIALKAIVTTTYSALESEGKMAVIMPTGLGIGCLKVKGSAMHYATFFKAYMNFINWMYLDTMAVDIAFLFDPVVVKMVSLIAQFATDYDKILLVGKGMRADNKACRMMFDVIAAGVEIELFWSIVKFLKSYVKAVNFSKNVMSTELQDEIVAACDALYPRFEVMTVAICVSIGGIGTNEDIISDFEYNIRLRKGGWAAGEFEGSDDGEEKTQGFFGGDSDDDDNCDDYNLADILQQQKNLQDDKAEGGVRLEYKQFLHELRNSQLTQDQIAEEQLRLLHILMNAESLTAPEELHANAEGEDDEEENGAKRGSVGGGNFGNYDEYFPVADGIGTQLLNMGNNISTMRDSMHPGAGAVVTPPPVVNVRTNKITFDDIVKRMILYVNNQMDLFKGVHKSTKSILTILMLYLKRGGDEDGKHERQCRLNNLKVTELVYKLLVYYSVGEVFELALELGTLLLEDGNRECQDQFINISRNSDVEGFFYAHFFEVLTDARAWVEYTQYDSPFSVAQKARIRKLKTQEEKEKIRAEDEEEATGRIGIVIQSLELLKELCEGHNLLMQNSLRDQSSMNRFSYNIVFCAASFIEVIASSAETYANMSKQHRKILVSILDFLIEVCQGPCPDNQIVVCAYPLLAACKIMLQASSKVKDGEATMSIKCRVIMLLAALMENQSVDSSIAKHIGVKVDKMTFDAVFEEFHFSIFCKQKEEELADEQELLVIAGAVKSLADNAINMLQGNAVKEVEEGETVSILELTWALCNIIIMRKKLTLLENLMTGKSPDVADDEADVPVCQLLFARSSLGSVEISWKGKTTEVMFPIPKNAKFLSNTTKENFLNGCDLTNCDTRVKDLMKNRNNFMDEVAVLSEFGHFFQFILQHYFHIKHLLFVVVLLLNFSLMLTLVHGSNLFYSTYENTISNNIMTGLGLILLLGYGSLSRYWVDQRAAFIYRGLEREQNEAYRQMALALKKDEVAVVSSANTDFDSAEDMAMTMGRRGSSSSEMGGGGGGGRRDSGASTSIVDVGRKSVLSFGGSVLGGGYGGSVLGGGSVAGYNFFGNNSNKNEEEIKLEALKGQYNEMIRDEVEMDENSHSAAMWNYQAFIPLIFVVVVYVMGCIIHYFAMESTTSADFAMMMQNYIIFAVICIVPVAFVCIRQFIVVPANSIALWTCVILDTAVDTDVSCHLLLVLLTVLGLFGYVFVYSVLLIDFLSMSVHARNTVRSVLQPWKPLLNVAMIFLIVIEIYGVFSLVRFGYPQIMDGYVRDDEQEDEMYCNSGWSCLGVIFYGGLMNSDIASVLAQSEPGPTAPGEATFTTRFFFDLSFFVIVGCLLFNMVTGIIVDTFSALREESEEIHRLQTEESFVSGVTAEMLEGIDGVSLEMIQDEQQYLWNYIYYSMYLEQKDAVMHDGVETFVSECIAADNYSWFPRKTSVDMEHMKGTAGAAVAAVTEGDTQIEGGDAGLEEEAQTSIAAASEKDNKLQEKLDKILAMLAATEK